MNSTRLKDMPKQYGSRGYGKKVKLQDVTPLKDMGIENQLKGKPLANIGKRLDTRKVI